MSNMTTKLKFCRDCRWRREFLFGPDRCLNPQVNVNNDDYLASGEPMHAYPTRLGRTFSHCHYEGNLFEPK